MASSIILDVPENQRQSVLKRYHNSSGKSPQQHVPTHHQHITSHTHGMRLSTASSHQNPLSQQQAARSAALGNTARNQSVVSSRPSVARGQENTQQMPPSQPPASSTYEHSVHPNTAPRMGTNHR